jgi:hypothetical protein
MCKALQKGANGSMTASAQINVNTLRYYLTVQGGATNATGTVALNWSYVSSCGASACPTVTSTTTGESNLTVMPTTSYPNLHRLSLAGTPTPTTSGTPSASVSPSALPSLILPNAIPGALASCPNTMIRLAIRCWLFTCAALAESG